MVRVWRAVASFECVVIIVVSLVMTHQWRRAVGLEASFDALFEGEKKRLENMEGLVHQEQAFSRSVMERVQDGVVQLERCRRDQASDLELFFQYQRIDDIFHRKFCTSWLKGQAAPPRLRLGR
ncbi:hypothetical protein [Microbacterium sp.]|uniref:hypothetical protein n=1 Tax=Microbacterium sp. TaxID=51671 RepID=UPI002E36B805|nr:hypothetical protein [Microbacterium sp.]HEX5730951.1 hypothetical protein [Microbacterium sp.]